MGVVLKHLYDEPPKPSSLRAELPKAVDTVVLRALRKEPEKRFPSAGALAEALAAAWPNARERGATAQPVKAAPVKAAPVKATPVKTTPAKTTPAALKTPPAATKTPAAPTKAAPTKAVTPDPIRTSPRGRAEAVKPTATPAKKAPTSAQPTPAAPPRRSPRLRVGLLTACIVGILLLYGFGIDTDTISRGWTTLWSTIGR
jgi:serine/threonine-protein kinase